MLGSFGEVVTADGFEEFEVYLDEHGVCVLRGELDEATGDRVEACLQAHPEVTFLDLGEVSFLDSAGLRCLLLARQRCAERGEALVLRRTSTAVRRLLRLAGVSGLFALSADAAHGVGAPAHRPARQDADQTAPDRRPSRTTP